MLTELHRNLLYEIYGVTPLEEVYVGPGSSVGTIVPASFSLTQSLVAQINQAFDYINADFARAGRVLVILAEYESISLDPSNIDREGYAFRLPKSLDRIKLMLRPYTGIFTGSGPGSNLTPMG
jgi:hypothetical protein